MRHQQSSHGNGYGHSGSCCQAGVPSTLEGKGSEPGAGTDPDSPLSPPAGAVCRSARTVCHWLQASAVACPSTRLLTAGACGLVTFPWYGARRMLLHGEWRGREKSTQRELAAATQTPPVPSSPPAKPDLPDQLPAGCGAAYACTAAPGPDAHPGLNEILKQHPADTLRPSAAGSGAH